MNSTSKLIITICSIVTVLAIFAGLYIHVFRGFNGFGRSAATVEDTKTLSGDVNDIRIDADYAEISVKYGDELSVSYKIADSLVPKVSLEDGSLSIKSGSSGRFSNFGMNSDYKIMITIPEGTELNSVYVETDAGDIDVDDIKCNTLTVCVDAGNIELEKIEASSMNIEADAANFEMYDSSASSLSVDIDAGNINLTNCSIESITADVDAGNIESHNSTIGGGSCDVDLGNISLSGKIGNVATHTSLGNASVDQQD